MARRACSRRSIPPTVPSSPAFTAGTGRSSCRAVQRRPLHGVPDNPTTARSRTTLALRRDVNGSIRGRGAAEGHPRRRLPVAERPARRPKAICIAGFLVVVAVGVNPRNALGLDGALKSLAAAPCALCSSSAAASASSLTASTLSPGPASPGSEYSTIGRVTTGERHPALRVRRAADPRTCSG